MRGVLSQSQEDRAKSVGGQVGMPFLCCVSCRLVQVVREFKGRGGFAPLVLLALLALLARQAKAEADLPLPVVTAPAPVAPAPQPWSA